MSKVEEVRGRLERELFTSAGWRVTQCFTGDLRALLDDHARLQAAHTNALKAMRQAVIALAHAQQGDPVYMQAYGVLDMAIEAANEVKQ